MEVSQLEDGYTLITNQEDDFNNRTNKNNHEKNNHNNTNNHLRIIPKY